MLLVRDLFVIAKWRKLAGQAEQTVTIKRALKSFVQETYQDLYLCFIVKRHVAVCETASVFSEKAHKSTCLYSSEWPSHGL